MATKREMSAWQVRVMRLLIKPFSRWNARRYLSSGGRSGNVMQGREICVVSMTGAKTGKRRDIP